MGITVNPDLVKKIKEFGAFDVSACFNCGNCTAVCPLSENDNSFPRKLIRMEQIGDERHLLSSVDPWMCYYCGECSATCPREANPGEAMMATRRYLTSRYDWTGLSKKMYLSEAWEIGSVLAVSLLVIALFAIFHGPMLLDHVALNTFAPVWWVDMGDRVMAGILTFFLVTNAGRMAFWILKDDKKLKIPLMAYVKAIPTFFIHFATQKRFRTCENNQTRWIKHLLLVTGYMTMLIMIVFFLQWFQTDHVYPIYNPQRLFGYYAAAVLLYVTVDFLIGRFKKQDEIHQFSHPSDWMFLILLFLTALTGILVNIFRLSEWPMSTYIIYVIHLAVAIPMLIVEVPFGKWSHLFYRPLAVYLVKVKEEAHKIADNENATVPVTA